MAKKKRTENWGDNGFEDWGGYMAAKKAKLQEQFHEFAEREFDNCTKLFEGVSIFVNGYTNPTADELKRIMMEHGGVYHHYMRPRITTHIIASNLPYSKIVLYQKSQNPLPLCKPEWITDSLKAGKLLDFRDYLLYSQSTITQPQLNFQSKEQDKTKLQKAEKTAVKNEKPASEEKNCIETAPRSTAMSSKDSRFLTEFYNNSRLHHISTMGATFKEYINELRDKSTGKFPGLEKLLENFHSTKSKISSGGRSSKREELNFDLDEEEEEDQSDPESAITGPTIMHIDMDCFFVSVGIRDKPELKNVPVAVTHAKGNKHPGKGAGADSESEEFGSLSEIASCSYEARKVGIRNGMFLGQALKLCPGLKTIKYDFEGYKEVSYALYDTIASYTLKVEAVSCDEMYVDCSEILEKSSLTPMEFARILREEIKNKTRCPVSTGFGSNKLQARLATKKAKPDGQFVLRTQDVQDYIGAFHVSDLPGVGYTTTEKLKAMQVHTCADLQKVPAVTLQKEFGKKTGEMLYHMARGIDNSKLNVEHVRKSVSAEVNYGIRFESNADAEEFLRKLADEVCSRLKKIQAKGRCVTLKLMVRSKNAPNEPAKFMGHGLCDYITRSQNIIAPVDDPVIISREVLGLWNRLQQVPEDIRGIGIQITRLEHLKNKSTSTSLMNFINKAKEKDPNKGAGIIDGKEEKSANFDIFLKSKPAESQKPPNLKNFFQPKAVIKNSNSNIDNNQKLEEVPSTSKSGANLRNFEVDASVLNELPEDIRKELLNDKGVKVVNKSEVKIAADDKKNSRKLADQGNEILIPSQEMDESVLSELPEDIRKEIMEVAKFRKKPGKDELKSKKPVKSQEMINFKSKKPFSGNAAKKMELPALNDIDMAVLVELPEDIRNEIMNEYRKNKPAEKIEEKTEKNVLGPSKNVEIPEKQETENSLEKNWSFSQVDPDFLAGLPEDLRVDVQMYCMLKKKEINLKKVSPKSANPKIVESKKPGKKTSVNTDSRKMKTNVEKTGKVGLFKKIVDNKEKKLCIDNEAMRPVIVESNKVGDCRGKYEETDIVQKNNKMEIENFENEENAVDETEAIISHNKTMTEDQPGDENQELLIRLVNRLFNLPVEEVQKQIRNWIFKSKTVNEVDFLSLATFLSMLPKKKRIEDLHMLLKTMHRCITKTGSCIWHSTYRKTIKHVQHYMQIEYRSNLMIPLVIRCNKDRIECNCDHFFTRR